MGTLFNAKFSGGKLLFLLFCALLIVLITIPEIYRYQSTPKGAENLMVHGIGEDYFYDVMVIRQGMENTGEIDQYTTEDTRPFSIHTYYLFLGRVGRVLSLSPVIMYRVGLYGAFCLYFMAVLFLIRTVLPRKYRFLGFFFAFFCGPFPPITISIRHSSIPIGTGWWTAMDQYRRLTMMPHHYIGQAGTICASAFAYMWIRQMRRRDAILAGLFGGFAALGYNIPVVVMLLSLSFVICIRLFEKIVSKYPLREAIRMSGMKDIPFLFLPALFVLGWHQYQMKTLGYPWDAFLAWEYAWYNHFPKEIYPYTLPVFLLSFGILWLFMVPVLVKWIKKISLAEVFLGAMVGFPIFLYILASHRILPIPKIRFSSVSPYVFGGIFATLGFASMDTMLKKFRIHGVVMTFLFAVIILNALTGLYYYWYPYTYTVSYDSIAYFSASQRGLIDAVNTHIPPYSKVMVPYGLGTVLPAFTKQKVFVGHMVNTKDVWNKYYLTQQLYAGLLPLDQVQSLFRSYGITYVIWEGRAPEQYAGILHEMFYNGFSIYSVSP